MSWQEVAKAWKKLLQEHGDDAYCKTLYVGLAKFLKDVHTWPTTSKKAQDSDSSDSEDELEDAGAARSTGKKRKSSCVVKDEPRDEVRRSSFKPQAVTDDIIDLDSDWW